MAAITDEDLDEFFREIEKLEISADNDDDQKDDTEGRVLVAQGGGSSSAESSTSIPRSTAPSAAATTTFNPPKGNEKNQIIQRAEKNQQSWHEFKVASKSEDKSDEGRPKISFTLNSKKGKKKKKEKVSSSSNPPNDEIPLPPPPDLLESKPQWIAVLDTCALLESLDEVCGLLKAAASSPSSLTTIEPLTVVIPYKLWSELDYQSKRQHQSDEKQTQARRAVRILNLAIQEEQQKQQSYTTSIITSNSPNDSSNTTTSLVAIRSQSRTEMNQTADDFGLNGVDINNDDHILCCARAEQKRLAAATTSGSLPAGGVVLLTLDNVLSGKARADHVTVYTPANFLDYYHRRQASLRERMQQQGPFLTKKCQSTNHVFQL